MMGFLSRRAALPITSYGYTPPPGATAHGWICANRDCGRSEFERVRRWPKACPQCGSKTDPNFDEPWAHEAKGVELRYRLDNNDEAGGYHADSLIVWRYKDAIQRGDWRAAVEAQADGQKRTSARLAESSWYIPGSISYMIVWEALEHGRLDDAASEIKFWSQSLATDAVEDNNAQRTNVRQLLDAEIRFLQNPKGAAHELAPWMREHASYVARQGRNVLTAGNITGLQRLGLG